MRTRPRDPNLSPPSRYSEKMAVNERLLGRYDFEDGASVRLVVEGNIDTEEALEMALQFIHNKRRELERRKSRITTEPGRVYRCPQDGDRRQAG